MTIELFAKQSAPSAIPLHPAAPSLVPIQPDQSSSPIQRRLKATNPYSLFIPFVAQLRSMYPTKIIVSDRGMQIQPARGYLLLPLSVDEQLKENLLTQSMIIFRSREKGWCRYTISCQFNNEKLFISTIRNHSDIDSSFAIEINTASGSTLYLEKTVLGEPSGILAKKCYEESEALYKTSQNMLDAHDYIGRSKRLWEEIFENFCRRHRS